MSNIRRDNTSGVPGVGFYARTKRWYARIDRGHERIHLGYFDTKDEAVSARQSAEAPTPQKQEALL